MASTVMMLAAYLLLLCALALLTAYTRNFQRTVVTLGSDPAAADAATLTPRLQWLRTAVVAGGWPAALALGLAFISWWKATALVVLAFALLVPFLGSFTPRPMSGHYVAQIRADLARRAAAGGRDAAGLRAALTRLEEGRRGRRD